MRIVILALAIAALASPAAAAPARPAPFVVASQADMFGYYMPVTPVRTGAFKLIDLALGAPEDFRRFAGGERFGGTWAPVLLEFAPAAAQEQEGDAGPYWSGSFRILPTTFAISDRTVSFSGFDKRLGAVRFEGTLDMAALAAERDQSNSGTGRIVLTGTLTVKGRAYPVSFLWFGGD